MQKTQSWLSQKLTKVQGRRKGGRRGASPPLPFSKGGRGGESALRVKILTRKIWGTTIKKYELRVKWT
jgi:hypothetical protein